jgi:pyruvate dehydrogenase E2 component (dihydrolipoamide acetyltransferase)
MIDITMPALSPTMETGTLSKWLVKVGDAVKSGDVLAEIETDKATMEVESIDEGVVAELVVPAGAENVPVGALILRLRGEGEEAAPAAPKLAVVPKAEPAPAPVAEAPKPAPVAEQKNPPPAPHVPGGEKEGRIVASPLARRVAEAKGVDLAAIAGSGPNGRIVRADVEAALGGVLAPKIAPVASVSPPPTTPVPGGEKGGFGPPFSDIPHTEDKLGNVRKVIARRLTEAKQTVPHFYLSSDVRIDALLKLRGELNKALEGRNIKLSVNDMVIKALALALRQVPKANVSFQGETLVSYSRADISVAVAAPAGLITPIVVGADMKPMSVIASEMQALAAKAREGKLQPHEFQGGTASVSNLGMYGIKQFDAVINPPQGMILAVGAGEKRPYVVDDALSIATVMTVTGSFDHRAIDGADGAELMAAFKALIEAPLGLVA